LKREVLRAASYLGKNIAFSAYELPIYEQSKRAFEKIKKMH